MKIKPDACPDSNGSKMLSAITRRCPGAAAALVALSVIGQPLAQAESTITPTLQLQETFITNKTSTVDESGQITTISPGIRYNATGANTNVSLDYSISAIYASGLAQEDEVDHSLGFQAGITHIPNRWNSQITSSIRQTNVSADGVQIVNPVIQSSNSREFRTVGVNTAVNGRVASKVAYNASASSDYAGYENSPSTDSAGITLGLNSRNTQKFQWSSSVTSRTSSTEGNRANNQQIDTFRADLSYRINARYSTFIAYDRSETDNQFLNDPNTTVGVTWTPSRNNFLKIGIGERGDDTTYTLASLLKTRRVSYSLNYDETVTTSRELAINDSNNAQIFSPNNNVQAFSPTSQSLAITPVLIKNGRATITLTGVRTNVTLAYFNRKTNRTSSNSNDESTEGMSINASRTLSQSASVSASISRQETEVTQKNTVDDASIAYNRQQSKTFRWSAEIRNTEQKSNVLANESKQNSVNFRANFSF